MKLWILDTDTLSLLFRGDAKVAARIADKQPSELAVTIVTIEEFLSGWYTTIRRAKTDEALERAYQSLQQTIEFAGQIQVLPFDKRAILRFKQLRCSHRRTGTNDLRIAAISLKNSATLVTRNTIDFCPIDGLRTENWAGG